MVRTSRTCCERAPSERIDEAREKLTHVCVTSLMCTTVVGFTSVILRRDRRQSSSLADQQSGTHVSSMLRKRPSADVEYARKDLLTSGLPPWSLRPS